jgi:photosystem I subunit X
MACFGLSIIRENVLWVDAVAHLRRLLVLQTALMTLMPTLLAMHTASPHTVEWSPNVAIVMCSCCAFSVVVGRFAIKNRNTKSKLVGNSPALFEGFGVAEMLGTFSFGHILGAGMILGMGNAGLL